MAGGTRGRAGRQRGRASASLPSTRASDRDANATPYGDEETESATILSSMATSTDVPSSKVASENLGSSSSPARGTTATSRGTSTARFRPKNVRRDESERVDIAREEVAKQNQRAAADAKQRARGGRFRGRSRGDAAGRGRIIGGASGAFSQAPTTGKLYVASRASRSSTNWPTQMA
jgi:DNA-directed RNA polymerase III subunit RPC4